MPDRAPSRMYNPLALEAWFTFSQYDWEQNFSDSSLQQGRTLYRQGKISGIELTPQQAIIHCTYERKVTAYVVLEWQQSQLSVRGSTGNASEADAIAVAGYYEIDELIADEIGAIAPDLDDTDNAAEHALAKPPTQTDEETSSPAARPLSLRLYGGRQGLRMQAFWGDNHGAEPALGSRPSQSTSKEREMLVRLTALSKAAGFQYRSHKADFLLADFERIPPFLARTRTRWADIFADIQLDYAAQLMAEGAHTVQIQGHAESCEAARTRMQLSWKFQVGQHQLTAPEAQALLKMGRGIHFMPAIGLIKLEADQCDELAQWRVNQGQQRTAPVEWPRYMIFSLFSNQGSPLELSSAIETWRAQLVNKPCDDATPLPKFLRDYQVEGIRWMAHLRAQGCHGLLADEMGLGKTVQVLSLIQHYPDPQLPSIIVCPASVVPVWEAECRRWYPTLQTRILSSKNPLDSGPSLAGGIWIASYTQLRRHKPSLTQQRFAYAVLDEAQQIKNPEAKVTQACCAIQADFRLALTGTPIENNLLDLWTLFRFLMPDLLGSRARFERAICHPNRRFREGFEERLQQQIQAFILRREKDRLGDALPPKVEVDLICPISESQQSAYQRLLESAKTKFGDDWQGIQGQQRVHVFSLITRLRQACCDPGLLPDCSASIEQSGKVQMLLTRLAEALSGNGARKVVVFSQFVQLLRRLKPLLKSQFPDLKLFELTGSTRDRGRPVAEFQAETGPALMLISLRAGGTGITLHAADYVFLMDPWWNPAVEAQAVDRVHRLGQTRTVFVYRMLTEQTIEARMQVLQSDKRALFERTIRQLEGSADVATDLHILSQLLQADTA